jgi:hypothetical protein
MIDHDYDCRHHEPRIRFWHWILFAVALVVISAI